MSLKALALGGHISQIGGSLSRVPFHGAIPMRPLPKTLQTAISKRFSDRVAEGWSEQDGFGKRPGQWAHWVYLKPGWHNAHLYPAPGLHIIHECSARDVLKQLAGTKPCDCEFCRLGSCTDFEAMNPAIAMHRLHPVIDRAVAFAEA
jgi:hypothetical protein